MKKITIESKRKNKIRLEFREEEDQGKEHISKTKIDDHNDTKVSFSHIINWVDNHLDKECFNMENY